MSDGFRPTLAIVFAPVSLDLNAVAGLFDRHDMDVFGCSSAGEIANDTVYESTLVGLLLDLDRDSYHIISRNYEKSGPFLPCKEIGQLIKKRFPNPALMVNSGGVTIDAEQIVFGLKAGLGGEAPIFGGLAADDLLLTKTFAFDRKTVMDEGIVALAFDADKVEVKGLATSGWEAVGKDHVITEASGNVIYSINHEPALDVFIRYFGYFDNTNTMDNEENVSTLSAQYPLQILREDGTTILRAPLTSNETNRSLLLAGGVRTGDKFRFSIAPGFEVIDQTISEFGDFKIQSDKADALILYSCKGRHTALGPMIEDEVKGIYDFWQKPMVGFFTYGEIGPTKTGVCEFHNETCSLVVLKEKSSS